VQDWSVPEVANFLRDKGFEDHLQGFTGWWKFHCLFCHTLCCNCWTFTGMCVDFQHIYIWCTTLLHEIRNKICILVLTVVLSNFSLYSTLNTWNLCMNTMQVFLCCVILKAANQPSKRLTVLCGMSVGTMKHVWIVVAWHTPAEAFPQSAVIWWMTM